jgi:hypothetical protein
MQSIIRIFVFALGICSAYGTVYNPIIDNAVYYNKQISISAVSLWSVLRIIDAGLSVDSSFSVDVAVVSASPGKVLTPIKHTIESMSILLFALTIISGVIAATLPAAGAIGAIILTAGLVGVLSFDLLLGMIFRSEPLARLARSLVTVGALFAVIIPVAYAGAFALGDRLTAQAWTDASTSFDRIAHQYPEPAPQAAAANSTSVPEAPPAQNPAAADKPSNGTGFLQGMLGGIQNGVKITQDSITGTIGAAQRFADQVGSGAIDHIKQSYSNIQSILAASSDLFMASIDLAVAYIVRLVVLPLVIVISLIWIFGKTIGPVASNRSPIDNRLKISAIEGG